MNFFKTAIMSLMLICGVSVANAQMPGGQMPSPEEMAKMQADQMKQTVNLNDDQYNKVLVVYKESGEKMRKAFEGGQPDFSKFGEIQEEQNKKFKEILTAEQYKKWDEHQQQMRQQWGGGGF